MSIVKDVKYLFKFSPIRADHLETFILSKKKKGETKVPGKKVKTKLLDPSRTKWVGKMDGMDLFEDDFVSVVKTLDFFAYIQNQKYIRIRLADPRPC